MSAPRNPAQPTRTRYGVLGFTLLLSAVAYLDRVCISTAAPAMTADLGLTNAQMGYVFTAFSFAYAVMEVPAGWLADRFGPRLMLTRVVIWWSLFTAMTGFAWGFASLFAVRLLFGLGEAGCYPGISRSYARWLPMRDHGRAFGLCIMVGTLGGAATQPLVVAMLGVMDWRHIFPIFGAVGVVWALAWLWWFRDDPHRHAGVNAAELELIGSEPPVAHPPVPWARLARSRNLLALCAMYFSAIYGWFFYLTWLPTYLLEARGFHMTQVGWLAAMPLTGIAMGVMVGGWFSDALARRFGTRWGRRLPGLIGLPAAAVAVVCAVATREPMTAALLLAAAAGLAALGVAPGWAACLEVGGAHTGVVTGAMNTFGNLGGALSPMVVGLCVQRFGSYDAAMLTMAAFYLVAAACWLVIDASKPLLRET
ncbi:MAG: MFS transporter [Verrucomicrobia bacterium]|nr:MFS transporter [Verrucomicrobiota bacterium]